MYKVSKGYYLKVLLCSSAEDKARGYICYYCYIQTRLLNIRINITHFSVRTAQVAAYRLDLVYRII